MANDKRIDPGYAQDATKFSQKASSHRQRIDDRRFNPAAGNTAALCAALLAAEKLAEYMRQHKGFGAADEDKMDMWAGELLNEIIAALEPHRTALDQI